ncbi:MAG TPA: DUF6632 domain-containing protein [Gemmatimonadales bacterium]
MSTNPRTAALRYAMIVVGIIFTFGIYPLTRIWPSGWSWGGGPSHYLPMILGVYATLGIFLILASRDPLGHRSLIWFTVWSSVVHALVMAQMALGDATERGHLLGDVPALLILALVLALLTLRAAPSTSIPGLGERSTA